MDAMTTKDGVSIYFKDWGRKNAQAIVFHHGWALSADDWDAQMLFFFARGFRVIAHDRRGHGRSTDTWTGNEMDTYAADVAALTDALKLKGAVHVGHATGDGEVASYVARAKPGRVSKAVLIGAVPPIMVKSAKYPGGTPIEVFDGPSGFSGGAIHLPGVATVLVATHDCTAFTEQSAREARSSKWSPPVFQREPVAAAAPERGCPGVPNGHRCVVRPGPHRRHSAGDTRAVHPRTTGARFGIPVAVSA